MRRKTIAFAVFLLVGTLLTACGSKNDIETTNSSEISEESDISADKASVETETIASETADADTAPTVNSEEEYKNGYDYLLYYFSSNKYTYFFIWERRISLTRSFSS